MVEQVVKGILLEKERLKKEIQAIALDLDQASEEAIQNVQRGLMLNSNSCFVSWAESAIFKLQPIAECQERTTNMLVEKDFMTMDAEGGTWDSATDLSFTELIKAMTDQFVEVSYAITLDFHNSYKVYSDLVRQCEQGSQASYEFKKRNVLHLGKNLLGAKNHQVDVADMTRYKLYKNILEQLSIKLEQLAVFPKQISDSYAVILTDAIEKMTGIVQSRQTDLFDLRYSQKIDPFHSRTLNFEWPTELQRDKMMKTDPKQLENLQIAGVEWDGHWGFNWILSNGLRSTQVSEEKGAMTEHRLSIKNGLRKV